MDFVGCCSIGGRHSDVYSEDRPQHEELIEIRRLGGMYGRARLITQLTVKP